MDASTYITYHPTTVQEERRFGRSGASVRYANLRRIINHNQRSKQSNMFAQQQPYCCRNLLHNWWCRWNLGHQFYNLRRPNGGKTIKHHIIDHLTFLEFGFILSWEWSIIRSKRPKENVILRWICSDQSQCS